MMNIQENSVPAGGWFVCWLTRFQVFWNVTHLGMLDPENGHNAVFRNVGNSLPVSMA
jgi:hypothetical protein